MKKYDCNKTADFAHEAKRMCEHYVDKTGQCIKCPLYATECDIDKITDRVVDVVQNWSDKHPEKPKLKRDEYVFIRMFGNDKQYHIFRTGDGTLIVNTSTVGLKMSKRNFQFINTGESWSFKELLELEVEDD